MENGQLLKRAAVYIVVFVLVTVSYINFTNKKDDNALNPTTPNAQELDKTKAIETDEEEDIIVDEDDLGNGLPEYMVLGELDLNE